jgi:hypothetical protein
MRTWRQLDGASKGQKSNEMMDKFMPLCFPNICNLIASFKPHPPKRGYIDNILLLQFKSHYDYIQDKFFKDIFHVRRYYSLRCSLTIVPTMWIWSRDAIGW